MLSVKGRKSASGNSLFSVLSFGVFVGGGNTCLSLSVNKGFTGSVEFQFGNDNLGRIDWKVDNGTVSLFSGQLLNVDAIFLTVASDYLSVTSLVFTSDDSNFVVLTDWETANVVLCP